MNPLVFLSKPALIIYAVIAVIGLYWGWSTHIANQATTACQTAQKVATVELKAGVADAGTTAVEGVHNADENDKPAVNSATDGLRNACPSRVLRPTGTGRVDAASTEAQDSGESATEIAATEETKRTLSDAADDIDTCQHQLNLFTGLKEERAKLTALTKPKE